MQAVLLMPHVVRAEYSTQLRQYRPMSIDTVAHIHNDVDMKPNRPRRGRLRPRTGEYYDTDHHIDWKATAQASDIAFTGAASYGVLSQSNTRTEARPLSRFWYKYKVDSDYFGFCQHAALHDRLASLIKWRLAPGAVSNNNKRRPHPLDVNLHLNLFDRLDRNQGEQTPDACTPPCCLSTLNSRQVASAAAQCATTVTIVCSHST
ncbi:hypothetical protein GGI35DRAFT_151631 [Trichoderma velutinum]